MKQRELFTIPLTPAIGHRFQPTGFPNLGAATFEVPLADGKWEKWLRVESEQSMANRLEATLWDDAASSPSAVIARLPHVRVLDAEGDWLTSSRLEAHRLASAYIRESEDADGRSGPTIINQALGAEGDRARAPYEFAEGLFSLDPMTLIHGLFLSQKEFDGNPKVSRAITAFIEARDVKEAHGGGVKKDSVHIGADQKEGRGAKEGYGMIPFDRLEWTAREILLCVDLDLAQLTSYGLGQTRTQLLADIARLELRRLLNGGLRLRTACDLVAVNRDIEDHDGKALPSEEELSTRVSSAIDDIADDLPEPLVVTWAKSVKTKTIKGK